MNSFLEFLITTEIKKSCDRSIQSHKFPFLEGEPSQTRLCRDWGGLIWGGCEKYQIITLNFLYCLSHWNTRLARFEEWDAQWKRIAKLPSVSLDLTRDYSTPALKNPFNQLCSTWIVIILCLNEGISHLLLQKTSADWKETNWLKVASD